MKRAIIRRVPSSFTRALGQKRGADPIDMGLARFQHQAYHQALVDLGIDVTVLDADDAYPDCCFVEDTAVIAGGVALITRLGAESRRGEEVAVANALEGKVPLVKVSAPARIDGGDVLRVGNVLYVGKSNRTSDDGLEAVRSTFEPLGYIIVGLPVEGTLHLKGNVSAPLPNVVVMAEGCLHPAMFSAEVKVIEVPPEEAYAANLVGVGKTILVPAGYPKTAALLKAEGFEVKTLDTSQFALADAALTCLSLFY